MNIMLTAQVLCTNAFYKQVQAERYENTSNQFSKDDTIHIMEKMISAMQKELDSLRQ